jgi:hypothetical protein
MIFIVHGAPEAAVALGIELVSVWCPVEVALLLAGPCSLFFDVYSFIRIINGMEPIAIFFNDSFLKQLLLECNGVFDVCAHLLRLLSHLRQLLILPLELGHLLRDFLLSKPFRQLIILNLELRSSSFGSWLHEVA